MPRTTRGEGVHRFFIRDFFAFYKEKSSKSCGHFGIGSWEVEFTNVECRPHDSASVEGYSPGPGPRKLGDQTMGVKTAEDSAHLGAGLFRILAVGSQVLRRLKLGPDIAIGEASQAVLSVHDRLE